MGVTLATLNKLGYEPEATASLTKLDRIGAIMSAKFPLIQDGTSFIGVPLDLNESIMLKIFLASVFKKTKEFTIRFILAVGSTGKFGIFCIQNLCNTIEMVI